jgi:hypothetical protein
VKLKEPALLTLVTKQLLLFPGHPAHNWRPSPLSGRGLRDKRSARQWIDSVTAYLQWRAGEPWRSLSDPEQRNCQERRDYLDAVQTVYNAYHLVDSKGPEIAVRPNRTDPSPFPGQTALAMQPRKVLVAALLAENPKLTDSKLLLSLKREKLARMLADVRMQVARESRPERRRA